MIIFVLLKWCGCAKISCFLENHVPHINAPTIATLTLGLRPRQGVAKVASQEGDLRVTSHALGFAKSVRE
jgi:hypothetical protein